MPSAKPRKQSEPKIRRIDRFPGSTLVVVLGDGTPRTFHNAMCSIDEHQSLMITRVNSDEEVSMVILYAAGCWNSVEQLQSIQGEANVIPN